MSTLFSACALSCRLKTPYSLISRFFLNLRAIHYHDNITAVNQTAVSTKLSAIRTHPFWRRPRRLTTTFTYGLGTRASINGDLATQTETDIPHVESVDLDDGMALRTQQDSDRDDIRLDVVTMDKT